MQTYSELIADCVAIALLMPRSPIQEEVRDLALAVANHRSRIIWDEWPFDNEKMDEFDAPAPVNGVITFPVTVDVVRAISSVDSNGERTRIWNQDELIAASQGESVASSRFEHLADAAGNLRRIRVASDDSLDSTTFKALCLTRYVPAVVDTLYDPLNPTATPTDYRVLNFLLDRAEPALKEFVCDSLREWSGKAKQGEGVALLTAAVKREQYDNDRERRVNPRYPIFDEVANR
jgi:hypothetical protein